MRETTFEFSQVLVKYKGPLSGHAEHLRLIRQGRARGDLCINFTRSAPYDLWRTVTGILSIALHSYLHCEKWDVTHIPTWGTVDLREETAWSRLTTAQWDRKSNPDPLVRLILALSGPALAVCSSVALPLLACVWWHHSIILWTNSFIFVVLLLLLLK